MFFIKILFKSRLQIQIQRGFRPHCAPCFQVAVVVVHRASLEATKLTRKNQDNYIYVGTSLWRFFSQLKVRKFQKPIIYVLNFSPKKEWNNCKILDWHIRTEVFTWFFGRFENKKIFCFWNFLTFSCWAKRKLPPIGVIRMNNK